MRVKQVEHALDMLEFFASEKSPKTLTALARKLDAPKSSTFNLISTLVQRGYLYETRPRGGYYPTRKLLDVAREVSDGDRFLLRIHSQLKTLADETGETVLLSVRDGGEVIYVDVVESAKLIRYFAKIGERRPVYATSSGKAILTTYAEHERTRLLQSLTYVRHERTTQASPDKLAADLVASIDRGWCEDRGEYTPDVMGIGVPVVHDEHRFGLAVAGPLLRMLERREELATLLLNARERISVTLRV